MTLNNVYPTFIDLQKTTIKKSKSYMHVKGQNMHIDY